MAIVERIVQLVTTLVLAARALVVAAPPALPVVAATPTTSCCTAPAVPDHNLLSCIAYWESRNGADPRAADNIYQFEPATFNAVATRLGRLDLVGRPPGTASRADQDALATALLADRGLQPWPTPQRRCS